MRAKDKDMSKWSQVIANLESMAQHYRVTNREQSQIVYQELLANYFRRALEAAEAGKPVVTMATSVPAEIFYAMNIVPLVGVFPSGTIAAIHNNYEECFSKALEIGVPVETCGIHRQMVACFANGWFPPVKAIVGIGGGCDTFAYSLRVAAELYDVPIFDLDTPYYSDEEAIQYLVTEFQDLIDFLEEVTNRKMDWDRFEEVMTLSNRQLALFEEIRQMCKTVPCPLSNLRGWQINLANWYYAGTEAAINFFEVLLGELRERIKQGKSPYPEEKLRLVDVFFTLGSPSWKITELLGKNFGAVIVAREIMRYRHMDQWEIDPKKPLDSLARKWFNGPLWAALQGPAENWAQLAVDDAIDFKADGAYWYNNRACRQSGAVGVLRKALAERAGVPLLVIDGDICDPSWMSVDELLGKFGEFFEMLMERKERYLA